MRRKPRQKDEPKLRISPQSFKSWGKLTNNIISTYPLNTSHCEIYPEQEQFLILNFLILNFPYTPPFFGVPSRYICTHILNDKKI
jgi:hypothetical protein